MKTYVHQRQVFYIPGFDPRGILFYHRLYRQEAAKQSAINGMTIHVGDRQRWSEVSYGWEIHAKEQGRQTTTRYELLAWDDIVRAHWPKHYSQLLSETFLVIKSYLMTGVICKMGKLTWTSILTGSYPILFVIGTLLATITAGYFTWYFSSPALGMLPALIPGIMISAILLKLSQTWGSKINAFWLLHNYAFAARWGSGYIPEHEKRLDAFADRIADAIKDADNDEIMIVGHSFGTTLAIPVIARLLAKPAVLSNITLVTLGEVIPMISFLPNAEGYRKALKQVAESPEIIWKDFTSPVDGACFALTNPVSASGITSLPGAGPEVLSARFHTLFHPPHYRRIKRDWYRIHFQYIMSFDLSGLFDYFAITAGAKCLTSRLKKTS